MASFTKAADLSAAMRKRADNVRRSALIAQESAVAQIKQKAIELTSGNTSTRNLALLSHPFGRGPSRRPRVRVGLLPINKQSGELQRSLRVFRRSIGNETAFQLQFTSSHSVAVRPGGTSRTVDRGFFPTLRAFAEPVLRRSHERAKREAERT